MPRDRDGQHRAQKSPPPIRRSRSPSQAAVEAAGHSAAADGADPASASAASGVDAAEAARSAGRKPSPR